MNKYAVIFGIILAIGTVHAQQSDNYRVPSDVQDTGGGDDARSTNYSLQDTIGEPSAGFGRATSYDLNAGYRQTTFLSLGCALSVDMGTIVFTGQRTGSGSCTVITDSDSGYSLSWQASGATLKFSTYSIAAFTPPVANTPATWSVAVTDSEWGARLRSTSTDAATEWGTDGVSEKYLNVSTSSRNIVSRSSRTDVGGSEEILQFRTEIGAQKIQPAGTYVGTVFVTASSL